MPCLCEHTGNKGRVQPRVSKNWPFGQSKDTVTRVSVHAETTYRLPEGSPAELRWLMITPPLAGQSKIEFANIHLSSALQNVN